MGLLNYSRTLIGKTAENVNDVQAMLNEVRAVLNGNVEVVNLHPALGQSLFVVGQIVMTGAASPDPGFLMCDGSPQQRTLYAALYARLGGSASPYGQGDGATTFNLPNLQGRVPVGVGTASAGAGGSTAVAAPGAAAKALGSSGGAETHVLTEAQLATHYHGVGSIYMATWAVASVGGGAAPAMPPMGVAAAYAFQNPAPATTFGGATANAGSNGAHPNMTSYQVVNFQIKF